MAFRYENPGYREKTLRFGYTVEATAEKSSTGVAWYQTNEVQCFPLPETREIWAKFDVYSDGSTNWVARCGTTSQRTGLSLWSGRIWTEINGSAPNDIAGFSGFKHILIHIKSDSTNGMLEWWLDGVQIYSYSGNVRDGSDLKDFFLATQNANNRFSNIIISNGQIGLDENTTPISNQWIQPVMTSYGTWEESDFAVKNNGHNEKDAFTSNDTSSYIYGLVSGNNIDLFFKKKVNINNVYFWGGGYLPTAIKLYQSDDGENWVAQEEMDYVSANAGELVRTQNSYHDYYRLAINGKAANGSDGRLYNINIDAIELNDKILKIDTKRRFSFDEQITVDTKRNLPNSEQATVDTKRILPTNEQVNIDTRRITKQTVEETFSFDTKRILPVNEQVAIDTARSFSTRIFVDTKRSFAVDVTLDFDLSRDFYHDAEVFFDLERKCNVVETIDFDLVRKFPAALQASDIVSITITMREQTVSDELSLDIASENKRWIGDIVKGNFLDYNYEMAVNSTSEEYGGVQQSVQLSNEIFDINKKKVGYSLEVDEDDPGTIENHVARINTLYGFKHSIVRAANIILQKDYSNVEQKTFRETVQDVIGWTSQVPWRMINAIVREGTVYYIQRGMEENVIELDDLSYTRPTIKRSIWTSNAGDGVRIYKIVGRGDLEPPYAEYTPATWKNHSYMDGQSSVNYDTDEAGRPIRTEIRNPDGSSTVIEYTYIKEGGRIAKTIERQTKTDKEGNSETTEVYKASIDSYKNITNSYSDSENKGAADSGHNVGTLEDNEHGEIWTFYNGKVLNYICKVYDIDGQLLDTEKVPAIDKKLPVIIGGTPGVSPIYAVVNYDGAPPFTEKVEGLPENLTLDDVREIREYAAKAIKEELELSIVTPVTNGEPEYKHVIDFRDAFMFKGNKYFLVSNTVTQTPKEYRQALSLVRWIL